EQRSASVQTRDVSDTIAALPSHTNPDDSGEAQQWNMPELEPSQLHRSAKEKIAKRLNGDRIRSYDLPSLVRMVEPSVVRIDSNSGVGAGFLLGNANTVVTNFHVIRGASKASVTFRD